MNLLRTAALVLLKPDDSSDGSDLPTQGKHRDRRGAIFPNEKDTQSDKRWQTVACQRKAARECHISGETRDQPSQRAVGSNYDIVRAKPYQGIFVPVRSKERTHSRETESKKHPITKTSARSSPLS